MANHQHKVNQRLVLLYLPEDPPQALIALGVVGAWQARLPDLAFDALCASEVKPLARHCESLRLVISRIESDKPYARDLQQGNQLSAFGYSCSMALTTRLHPQLILRFARVKWRLGWKRPFSSLLLTRSFVPGDWQGLWRSFAPDLPFPASPPVAKLSVNKAESHSAMLWLGLDKSNTLLIIADEPLDQAWLDALAKARKLGAHLLGCGKAASEQNELRSLCANTLSSPYEHQALTALPSIRLVLGQSAAHQILANAYSLDYQDTTQAPPPNLIPGKS